MNRIERRRQSPDPDESLRRPAISGAAFVARFGGLSVAVQRSRPCSRHQAVDLGHVLSIPPALIPVLREILNAAELAAIGTGMLDRSDYHRVGLRFPGDPPTPFDDDSEPVVASLPPV